jgi:GNAT superfamily N-acetyltransferase
MKISELLESAELENVIIVNSVEDSFRGGYGGTLVAKTPEQQLGYLTYTVYNDVPAISMIWVAPEFRRYKIARKLLKALQELSPTEEIDWGYTTDDGSRLKQSIDFIKRPNKDIINKIQKLKSVKSKLAQFDYKLEELRKKNPELAGKYVNTVSDKWNKLNDMEYRLENELSTGKREYSNLIPEGDRQKYLGPTTKVKINKRGWQIPLNKKGFGV